MTQRTGSFPPIYTFTEKELEPEWAEKLEKFMPKKNEDGCWSASCDGGCVSQKETTMSVEERAKNLWKALQLQSGMFPTAKAEAEQKLGWIEEAFRTVEREARERAASAARNARICDSCQDRAGDAVDALAKSGDTP